MPPEDRHLIWERRQAELWDRVFQVTQEVVTLAGSLGESEALRLVRDDLVRTATSVGVELVRANAAEEAKEFDGHVKQAKLKAVETDWWLRLIYVLEQQDEVQRDLSSVLTQYGAIIALLDRFLRHTRQEGAVIDKHARGPKVSL